jgi:hypothetical protein
VYHIIIKGTEENEMKENRYQEIRRKYVEAYPHLGQIKSKKVFAQNALRLAAPKTVTVKEVFELSTLC